MNSTQRKIKKRLAETADFLPYVEEIRFPMYKTLDDGVCLTLSWPITALIGSNGTNKSSILQAISAAPEGRSLAQFWFSTEVDDINRGPRGKAGHRFIYKYKFDESGVSAECRKYRGSKVYRSTEVPRELRGKRDPDYWEPTKRVASDGMLPLPEHGFDKWLSNKRDRWNQVKKQVIYLDFRSELSAFDKYIHHQSFNRWTADATQKRYQVVRQSKWIARALNNGKLPKSKESHLIDPVRVLDEASVQTVATILGKPIEKVDIVEHSFFGPTGYTVRLHLKGDGSTYSEAHAGSGEYAVVRLVDAIKNAPKRSLILLDEPEVSLHPGAQTKLMQFIEAETLINCHQVVISTHSPVLAADLPSQAIKVLGFDAARNRVVLLADSCSPTEAFAHLGHMTTGDRPRLIVEDKLAEEIVRGTLRRYAPKKLDALDVISFPGGAGGVVKNVLPSLAISGLTKAAILLDGDQRPATREPGFDASSAAKGKTIDELSYLWTSQFHASLPNLHSDSDHSRDAANMTKYIEWADVHIGFLPGSSPEQALASALGQGDASETSADYWKNLWVVRTRGQLHLTDEEDVPAATILSVQQNEIANLPHENALLLDTYNEIQRIIPW